MRNAKPPSTLEELIEVLDVEKFKDQIKSAEFTKFDNDKLIHLDLGLCEIEQIPEDLFINFTDIEILNLSGNRMKEIPQKLFWSLTKLHTLGLRKNEILTLKENHFANNPALKLINIKGNPVASNFDLPNVNVIS